eukprot:48784_1
MFEDESVNTMVDALQLWSTVVNNTWFEKTSFVLIFNKLDLFKQKIKENKPITLCPEFEDFGGDTKNVNESIEYIKNCFLQKVINQETLLFTIETTACDENDVKKLFNTIWAALINNNISEIHVKDDDV